MKKFTPEMEQHCRLLLDHIVKNPVVQHGGYLNAKGSMKLLPPEIQAQVRKNSGAYVLNYLRNDPNAYPTLKPIPLVNRGKGGYRNRGSGLRVGPKVAAMSWEDFKQPWVYELVCEPTGRRYIGAANRPDLRRAVHFYWLGNIDKVGASNIFRRLDRLKADVKQYGRDAFYLDVLERVPGWKGKCNLLPEEWKWMEHYGQDVVYNDMRRHTGVLRRDEIDAQVRPLWKRTNKIWVRLRKIQEMTKKLRADTMAKRKKITGKKWGKALYTPEVAAKVKPMTDKMAALSAERAALKQELVDLHRARQALFKQRPPTVPQPREFGDHRQYPWVGKGRGRPAKVVTSSPEPAQGTGSPQR